MKKIIQLSMVSFCLMLILSCKKNNTPPANNTNTSPIFSFEYTVDGVTYTWSGGVQTTNGNASTATNNGIMATWSGIRDVPNGANWFPQINALFPAKVGTYTMDINSVSTGTGGLNLLFSNSRSASSSAQGKVIFNVTSCPTGLYSHITGNFSGEIGEIVGRDIVMHSISGKFDACNMTP